MPCMYNSLFYPNDFVIQLHHRNKDPVPFQVPVALMHYTGHILSFLGSQIQHNFAVFRDQHFHAGHFFYIKYCLYKWYFSLQTSLCQQQFLITKLVKLFYSKTFQDQIVNLTKTHDMKYD